MNPRAWIAAWRRFWFTPSSPVDLGVSRALFFGGLLVWYARVDFGAWADVSPVFWEPLWLFYRLDLPVLPASTIGILAVVWRCALASAALGCFTRASSGVAFVLGTYLLGLPYNFGKLSHPEGAVVLILGVLAVARAGDAVSLDAWRRRGRVPVAPSPEYTWPVRTAWLVLALVFLGAGISKLRHAGLAWVTSDTLRNTFLVNHYHQSVDRPLVSWGLAIADHPALCHALAAGTVAIELSYPIATLVPALRFPLVAAGVGLLLGFRIVLGPAFLPLVICHVFWVPWERLLRSGHGMRRRVRRSLAGAALVAVAALARPAGAAPDPCKAACKATKLACVAEARTVFTTAKEACALAPAGAERKACKQDARAVFAASKAECKAEKVACAAACGDGGTPDGPTCGDAEAAAVAGITSAHDAVRANPSLHSNGTAQPAPDPPLAPLCYSATVAAVAQAWADGCQYAHNPGRGNLGENIYAEAGHGSGTAKTPLDAVRLWSAEAEWFDHANPDNCTAPNPPGTCLHYTQVVWRDTTSLGCARKQCTTNSPFGPDFPTWTYVVCDYAPPGNLTICAPPQGCALQKPY